MGGNYVKNKLMRYAIVILEILKWNILYFKKLNFMSKFSIERNLSFTCSKHGGSKEKEKQL